MKAEETDAMIVIRRGDDGIQVSDIWELPFNQFGWSWDDSHKTLPAKYAVVLTPQSIWLAGKCETPPTGHQSENPGEFTEGIWKHDAIELFMAGSAPHAYQEFNLSPSGAWWSALFSYYRQADERSFQMPRVQTWAESLKSGWRAAIQIERKSLSVDITTSTRLNVCMIVGKDSQHFLSANRISTEKPDFHRIEFLTAVAH